MVAFLAHAGVRVLVHLHVVAIGVMVGDFLATCVTAKPVLAGVNPVVVCQLGQIREDPTANITSVNFVPGVNLVVNAQIASTQKFLFTLGAVELGFNRAL